MNANPIPPDQGLLSAEELIEIAIQSGLYILAWSDQNPKNAGSISISKHLYTANTTNPAKREIGELLPKIPRYEFRPPKVNNHLVAHQGRTYRKLEFYIPGIDPGFVAQLVKLAPPANQIVERREKLNVTFDSKLEEEVSSDPIVKQLSSRLAQKNLEADVIREAIANRKKELLAAGEPTRESFLYVADDREL